MPQSGEAWDVTEFRGPLWPFDSWESSTEGCRNELVVLRSMMTIITRGCCKLVSRALPTCLVFQMLLAAATSALSQPSRVAEIATYRGADRELRLIEGAKREGELMFYTSILVDDLAAVGAAFERRYGIKVKSWRADSESFLRRIVAESRARRYEVDVMHGAGAALEALYREDLLQEVKSPYIADLMPEAMPPHRQWAPMILNMIVQAYNTKIVQKEALPASYRDLLKPDWRGKLGIEADDYDWFAQIVTELGEPEGLKLFHQIATTTGISVRKGHSVLTNLVAAGEVALALTTYGFAVDQAKAKGAPLDWFAIPPAAARPAPVGLARSAPHPYAAVLFYDFLLSDAQQILANRQYVVASRKVASPFTKGPLTLIDPGIMLDNAQKWQDLYRMTIANPPR